MTEPKKKYDNRAIAGTLLFHGVLLLCVLYFGLSTPLPLPEEEGVIVNLGFSTQGTGMRQPLTSSPPPPQPEASQAQPRAEDVATQSTEESVAIPEAPQTRPQRQQRQETPRETTRPQQETAQAQPQPQPEPEPQPQVDPRALFPGRDRRTTESQSQGETGQQGNQGRPDGSVDGTSQTGGGQGSGVQFSLSGRRANYLPIPEYASQSQGRVVVTINVNRNGEVTRAEAGARGTTTSDRALWTAAENAARRARFDVKNDAPHEQVGTITYNFIRLN